ncbi:MAG: holo-ACP synthase [Candidatus Eisenbacteria bacterium]
MVVGLGIDIVDLEEFRAGLNDSRVDRLYLPDEVGYARTQARSWENLGARLAAKRAVFRALGAEVGGEPDWHDVEVLRRESGELDVRLTGGALALAGRLGARECSLSMTHTRRTALAVAILQDGSK